MNRVIHVALCILPLIAAGCRSGGGSDDGSQTGASAVDIAATASPASAYSVPSSASVDDLVALAIARHPSVAAARHKVERLESMVDQVSALPDPSAKVTAGQLAETAAGRVDGVIGVEQRIPFPGKRRARAERAHRQADVARAELDALRLSHAARVRDAYWRYYQAARTVGVLGESRAALVQMQESVDVRVRADKAAQQDLLKVGNELGLVDQKIITATAQVTAMRARLNSLLHRPVNAPLPSPRKPVPSRVSTALDAMIAEAQSRHPDVAAAKSRVAMFNAQQKMADLERWPDFAIGMQYGAVSNRGLAPSANGRDQFGATVGVTIPLWRKKLDAIDREAREGLAEAGDALAAVRSEVGYNVAAAVARVDSARRVVTLFESSILPDANQALELALVGYSADTEGFIDVIDAWRQSLAYQLQQVDNQAALGAAAAALKLAAGIE
ncbi:TolC family protein [Sulfuriroseicoccus oceanibius]|uniref:TolC family protein n=1 Tax=Sulfuriroseicoccus oceanibius TaxID=2707525 RepID=A0A6B3LDT0_9BACT|nr:TolC family protein [Sulfuriroseicoccus oceanibius]QQL45741.1 TolC family protein [Sulfuriroseicoccus oceanibius]